jgi:hypothetical protein
MFGPQMDMKRGYFGRWKSHHVLVQNKKDFELRGLRALLPQIDRMKENVARQRLEAVLTLRGWLMLKAYRTTEMILQRRFERLVTCGGMGPVFRQIVRFALMQKAADSTLRTKTISGMSPILGRVVIRMRIRPCFEGLKNYADRVNAALTAFSDNIIRAVRNTDHDQVRTIPFSPLPLCLPSTN